MKNKAYIDNFLEGISDIADRISREDIDNLIEVVFAAWRRGNSIFMCGNGGSAGTSTHLAADLFKCTIVENMPRLRAISLVDNIPLMSALTNDDGWDNVYVEQLKTLFRPGDVVLAISVHGGSGRDKAGLWSQNLLKAIDFAKQNGGYTLGFSGFDGGALKELADVCIVVPFDTTPHVEAFHVVLHHLITFRLAEKIRAESETSIIRAGSSVS